MRVEDQWWPTIIVKVGKIIRVQQFDGLDNVYHVTKIATPSVDFRSEESMKRVEASRSIPAMERVRWETRCEGAELKLG